MQVTKRAFEQPSDDTFGFSEYMRIADVPTARERERHETQAVCVCVAAVSMDLADVEGADSGGAHTVRRQATGQVCMSAGN